MDHFGRPAKKVEEIPEDLRCKRSDGKQWRCSALSMPDKTVCEKHYIQAKKRAANSALRASLKKGKKSSLINADINTDMPRSMSPMNADVKENIGRSQVLLSSDAIGARDPVILDGPVRLNEHDRIRLAYNICCLSKDANLPAADCHVNKNGKNPEFTVREGITCHQCGANECVNALWCTNCDQNGYCANCISQWYADIPVDEFRKRCPACQNICSCKICLSCDNLIKNKVHEIAAIDKLWYFHSLLSYALPFLKQIYSGQCFEIAMETKIHGVKTDIPRANINTDEQMSCNLCKLPILDFHRHCPECFFDLCLTCCRDIRRVSLVITNGDSSSAEVGKYIADSKDEIFIDFGQLYPKWKASSDGSIPCLPKEVGGCGYSKLTLRRILKINWVAKLVKNAEEIVTGCKVTNKTDSDKCNSEKIDLHHCYYGNDNLDNMVYCPTSENLKKEGINHFRKHWLKGQPVMIRNVFDHSLASSWDPMSIWRGINETSYKRMPEDNALVKVTDHINKSEIDIDLTQFIKGYSEGLMNEDGSHKLLMLKDWPHPSAWEEFIYCQRPEFLTNLPFVEFIHSKWGLLNLAAKIPHDNMQIDVEPKIYISYGAYSENHSDVPATNLRINMGDTVYLLMHSTCTNNDDKNGPNAEKMEGIKTKSIEEKPQSDVCLSNSELDMEGCNGNGGQPKIPAGAIWDIFRRQDVPKLNEFFRVHSEELTTNSCQAVAHPVYEQTWYVNEYHKQKLKEEYGIEPWTLEQHVGEAIFIPAGCPFQVQNLQSTVQLGLDFLLPESLGEAIKITQEIRGLSDDQSAKLAVWEVGKMTLYAASFAIREIHKIVLDPSSNLESKFEDKKLTAMVAENLTKLTKRRQIACT